MTHLRGLNRQEPPNPLHHRIPPHLQDHQHRSTWRVLLWIEVVGLFSRSPRSKVHPTVQELCAVLMLGPVEEMFTNNEFYL